mgnify:CR=1 FL=1
MEITKDKNSQERGVQFVQTFAQRNVGFLYFFSCIVLEFFLNLQPKKDTN